MPVENQEVYAVIIAGGILALLLVGFIVLILFLYQRRQHRQEQELALIKDQYDHELLRSQLEIQESTFRTIAQELHDNIGQVLSVVKLSLSILPLEKSHPSYESVQNSREMLNKVIFDMADLTKSLHTDRISQIGIAEAIRFELDILRKNGLVDVDFKITGKEFSLEEKKGIFLFRMFQEILNNILKHAKATKITATVHFATGYKFEIKVADNGIGFITEKKQSQVSSSSGIGLKSLRNRAQLAGAKLFIESELGKGTEVTIVLPIEPEMID